MNAWDEVISSCFNWVLKYFPLCSWRLIFLHLSKVLFQFCLHCLCFLFFLKPALPFSAHVCFCPCLQCLWCCKFFYLDVFKYFNERTQKGFVNTENVKASVCFWHADWFSAAGGFFTSELELDDFFLTCVAAFTEDTNPVPVCSHVKSVIVAVGGLTVSAATFVYNSDLIYDASFTWRPCGLHMHAKCDSKGFSQRKTTHRLGCLLLLFNCVFYICSWSDWQLIYPVNHFAC